MLLSYLPAHSFHSKCDADHTNRQESRELLDLLLKRGHVVDVVGYNQVQRAGLARRYELVIDIHDAARWLARAGTEKERFILYSTGCHPTYSNLVIARRCEEVYRRTGIEMKPVRLLLEPHAWEGVTDFAYCGEDFQLNTYRVGHLPCYKVLLSTLAPRQRPALQADRQCPRFVYLGSGGFLLRGLDLLFELFQRRKDWRLDVFTDAYKDPGVEQLFPDVMAGRCPNIRLHGFSDIDSSAVLSACAESVALLYPTFSDSSATSVLNAAVRGCIPVVTPMAGVRLLGAARLVEPAVEAIEAACERLLQKSGDELNEMKHSTRMAFEETYNLAAFRASFTRILDAGRTVEPRVAGSSQAGQSFRGDDS